MNITRAKLKETLRTIVNEESEYQTFFKTALEKAGKSIPEMSEEEKKAFFNKIDAAWDAKGEKNEALIGNQHKLDIDGDGEIDASDLAALRAGKKKEEGVNEYNVNKKFGSKYDIGAGQFPTGTVFWNRAEDEDGDYKKLAHIADNGKITFYDKSLPSNVKKHIEDYAKTKTESVNEDVNFTDGKYRFYSKNSIGYLTYNGKLLSKGDYDFEGGDSYWMSHSSWKGQKAFDTGNDVIKYFKSKNITTESVVTEAKDDFVARHGKSNILLKKGYKHHTADELEALYDKVGKLVKGLNVKDVNVVFESVNEAKLTKKGDTYYVDSNFVNLSKKGGNLKHLGMGDFAVDVDGGETISFHRVSEKIPGFSGRTHRVAGNGDDFKKLTKLMGIKSESVNEGKKVFKVNPGIGKAKYSISSHDGKKTHKDGSDFYDIEIFNNKVDLEKGIKKYTSNGFVKESVNEAGPGLWANIRAKKARGGKPAHGNSDAHKKAVAAGKKINKEESVNEAPDAKKRFMFDFYNDSFQKNTERETNFLATTLESAIKAAEHMCKVTGYGYVEIYYKDLFLGSMKKQNGFKFVKGRGYSKFKSIN